MPTKTSPETQLRALLVRDAVAVLKIEYPNKEDDRFRESMVARIIEEIPELELSQLTRLHEAASDADAKHAGITDLRTAIRTHLGKRYDLAGARKRAKATAAATA
jgi:hypothetical protein